MGKIDYTTISGSERQRMIRDLAKFLLSIKEEGDMIQVLYRLLTRSEVVMLGRRLQVAEKLLYGWSYQKIREKMKVGIATIKSVDNWLEYAIRDYDLMRSKQKREEIQRQTAERSRRFRGPAIGLPGQLLLRSLLGGR